MYTTRSISVRRVVELWSSFQDVHIVLSEQLTEGLTRHDRGAALSQSVSSQQTFCWTAWPVRCWWLLRGVCAFLKFWNYQATEHLISQNKWSFQTHWHNVVNVIIWPSLLTLTFSDFDLEPKHNSPVARKEDFRFSSESNIIWWHCEEFYISSLERQLHEHRHILMMNEIFNRTRIGSIVYHRVLKLQTIENVLFSVSWSFT